MPNGNATLDQLEDIVRLFIDEMGMAVFASSVRSSYRESSDPRQRYTLLVSMFNSVVNPASVRGPRGVALGRSPVDGDLAQRALNRYNDLYGSFPVPLTPDELALLPATDDLFNIPNLSFAGQTTIPRTQASTPRSPAGGAQAAGLLQQQNAPETGGQGTDADPRIAQLAAARSGTGSTGAGFDPGQNVSTQPFDNPNQALFDDLARQRNEQLQDINNNSADLQAQNQLATTAAQFGQRNGLLATTPLTPTQGNVSSGFQQQRRARANTEFGFAERQRELTYAQQLRDLATSRQRLDSEYDRAVRDLAEQTALGLDENAALAQDNINEVGR